MSQRKTTFACGEFYHVYNRGNSKQVIFRDAADYIRFQLLLFVANASVSFNFREVKKGGLFNFERREILVHIGAYCLMPNHFHILLTPVVENGVQLFMQKLSTSYSMYFNKRHERSGGLFEGRFKSVYVDSDEYLKYLFAYIHLNPVKLIQADWKEVGIRDKKKTISYLSKYKYSSLPDYVKILKREEQKILSPSSFPEYFLTPESWFDEVIEWLSNAEDSILGPA